MKAYIVCTESIHDIETYDEYRAVAPATFEQFGGRFIARGGNLKVLEGEWPLPRLVIIEFPSREKAEDWYNSRAYQQLIPLRLRSAIGNFVVIDGLPD